MNKYSKTTLKKLLNQKVEEFNNPSFIQNDPISIPHQFTLKEDIELVAFWTSMFAWGQRKTIINKSNELFDLMDGAPHQFITQHKTKDLKRFETFKHRTFQPTDTLYFIQFFKHFYKKNKSLETAFSQFITEEDEHIGKALEGFHQLFFALPDAPQRTRKHVSTPARKSTCKRLCMFLRWMVRDDSKGVDFGIWKNIKPAQLLCPLDVHVDRVARKLNLISRKQTDWQTTLELTKNLREFDPQDPVKYDFALFGMGILEK